MTAASIARQSGQLGCFICRHRKHLEIAVASECGGALLPPHVELSTAVSKQNDTTRAATCLADGALVGQPYIDPQSIAPVASFLP